MNMKESQPHGRLSISAPSKFEVVRYFIILIYLAQLLLLSGL